METIADKIGISKRTVVTSIKKLEKLEYIKVEKQKAKIGNYNKYNKFKHLVLNEETEVKSTIKKTYKKKEQGEKIEVLNGQVTVEEAIEYIKKVKY